MKDILQIMIDMLSRKIRRGTLYFIDFSKPHVQRLKNMSSKSYKCIYVAENEEQKNYIEKNENRYNELYDIVIVFDSKSGKNHINNLEKFMKNKKIDAIIGNPPYEGQGNPLYLKIAEICVKNCEKVIWLCPTQWTNTLKNVKWYDYYKENLNCEFFLSVGNPFDNAFLANDVGIYVFGENKIDLNELVYNKFKNARLVKSIWEKNLNFIKTNKSIWDFNQIDYKKKYYVHNTGIRGNVHESKPCWDWTTLFGTDAHTDFSKETVVFDSRQIMWNFNTKSECENFISCYETDIMMFMLYCVKMNNNNHRGECAYIPWLGDYTKQWTEAEIANELGLTQEEVDYIHEEMKNFGWKAKPNKGNK